MRKIAIILVLIQLMLISNVFAQETLDVQTINVGSPSFTQQQGDNGWSLCYLSTFLWQTKVYELTWNENDSCWTTTGSNPPKISKSEMLPGESKDLEFQFIPNKSGLYKLTWDISWIYGEDSGGNGMTLSVINNNTELWNKKLNPGNPSDCEITTMLEVGDVVHFRADSNGDRAYDSFKGFPSVELLGVFYQKDENGLTELNRDRCNKAYIADDLMARISDSIVMPTEKYAVVKRYIFTEDSRYRIHGKISSENKEGGGNVVRFYKNDELIREQLCLCGENTDIDIRMLCNKGDILDIEVSVAEYEGFNFSKWDLAIESIPATVRDCKNTTTAGYNYNVSSTVKLSEYISDTAKYGTKLYTEVQGVRYPMQYDKNSGQWQETSVDTSGVTLIPKVSRETPEEYIERVVLADAGYVSPNIVSSTKNWNPGSYTIIDVPINKNGNLLIDGNFRLTSEADAELVNVYLNDECIWSNRIGGEVSIKYDEPYDTKYFMDKIHTILNVKAGDVLSFRFNKWRKQTASETVDISNITLKYIEGKLLSKTTEWKLNNSVLIDTSNGKIYADGEHKYSGAYIENGITYIPSSVASSLWNFDGEGTAVGLRQAAESSGNTVVWVADKYAVIHKGIPGMFTWNDISELKAHSVSNGGIIYE